MGDLNAKIVIDHRINAIKCNCDLRAFQSAAAAEDDEGILEMKWSSFEKGIVYRQFCHLTH